VGITACRIPRWGFYPLANVATAVEAAYAAHRPDRIAIVDWDVHHGNGAQTIFFARDDTLFISLHQDGCFRPGYGGAGDRGLGCGDCCDINIPLLPGNAHKAYLYAMDRIVCTALERFRPDLIVVSSGLDANGVVPLARMLALGGTYRAMTERLMAQAERHCGQRLILVHEGGYSQSCVPSCGYAIMEALCGA
jgi:acetoin utilization deacetylase AcuC-like enzyme